MLHVSETATPFLQVVGGTPSRSLSRLLRPELRAVVHAALFHARREQKPVSAGTVLLSVKGEPRRFAVRARPAPGDGIVQVIFEPLHTAGAAEASGADASGEPDAVLEAELQQTREQLQISAEEFETTQEELKAQNEELQSMNEELRSTAEELETSKEEAQSMAEELRTVNDELKEKVTETIRAKDDIENLIVSTEIATLFLDRDLRIKRFTPHVRDLFHVLASDVGRPLADLAQKFGGAHLVEDAEAVLDRLEVQQSEVQNRDGRWFLVHVRPYRTVENLIDGVVVTFVDITEQRRNEEAIRAAERQFRALVEASAQIVWTANAEGRAAGDSPSWRAFTGQTVAEWTGGRWPDAVHPEDREALVETWRASVEAGAAFEMQFRLRHAASGTWRWMHTRAVPLHDQGGGLSGFIGMSMDVTVQREAEEALRASEERFRRMAEAVPDVLFTATPDGEVDYVNSQFEVLTGLPPEAALGTRLWPSLVHRDDRERTLGAWTEARQQQKHFEIRHRLDTLDGECWVITRALPVLGDDGTVEHWFGTITDVNSLANAEEQVRQFNATLAERVMDRTRQVRRLSSRLAVAEQEERRRIAHVLHDDLQQQLAALGITLQILSDVRIARGGGAAPRRKRTRS